MLTEALESRAKSRPNIGPQWRVGISIYRASAKDGRGQACIRVPRDFGFRLIAEVGIPEADVRWQMRGTAADGLELCAGRNGVKGYREPKTGAFLVKLSPPHYGLTETPTGRIECPVRLERRGDARVVVLGKVPAMIGPQSVGRKPHWLASAEEEYRELVARGGPPEPRPDDDEGDEPGDPLDATKAAPPPREPTVTRVPPRPAAAPGSITSRPDRFNPALPSHITFPKRDEPEQPWRARMRQWEEASQREAAAAAPPPRNGAGNGNGSMNGNGSNGHGSNGHAKPATATIASPPALHTPDKYTQVIDESVRSEVLAAIEMLNAAMDRDKSGVVVLRLSKNRVSAKRATIALTDL